MLKKNSLVVLFWGGSMKFKKLSFYRMVSLAMQSGLLFWNKNNTVEAHFPKKIGDYTFVKNLHEISETEQNTFAVYINSKNKKAFAKLCNAANGKYEYAYLEHELYINSHVTKLFKSRIQNKLFCAPPKIIKTIKNDGNLLVLFEYFDGKVIRSLTQKERINAFSLIFDSLKEVNSTMIKQSEKNKFPQRSRFDMSALFLYLFLKSSFLHPEYFLTLLQNIPFVVLSFISDKEWKVLHFAHRDIHTRNIMMQKNKVMLTDFSNACFAPESFDKINSLISVWDDRVLRKYLLELIEKEISDGMSRRYVESLLFVLLIHRLSDRTVPGKVHEIFNIKKDLFKPSSHEKFLQKDLNGESIFPTFFEKIRYIFSFLKHRNEESIFPQKIGSYEFIRNIDSVKIKPYMKGIYRSRTGQVIVAKIFMGSKNNLNYKNLIREAKILHSIRAKIQKNFVRYPEFVGVFEGDEYLVLFTKFEEGKSLGRSISAEKFLKMYKSFFSEFKTLSFGTNVLVERDKKYYLLNITFFFIISLFKNVKNGGILISSYLNFWKGILEFNNIGSLEFVHGDLHPENVILQNKNVILFDYEQAQKTYPVAEYATTLCSVRNSMEFCEKVIDEMREYIRVNNLSKNAANSIMIFIAFQNLAGVSTQAAKDRIFSLLQFLNKKQMNKNHAKSPSLVGI